MFTSVMLTVSVTHFQNCLLRDFPGLDKAQNFEEIFLYIFKFFFFVQSIF